jgi:hypothetical protein
MSSSSASERGRQRWIRGRLPTAFATVALLLALTPSEAHQAVAADPVTLTVEGATLGAITTSGLELTPAFSPGTTDYTLRCRSGANTVGITLDGASGGSIRVGRLSGPRVSSSVTLVENQALVVEAPGGTDYWIRCLPSDFPLLKVTRPGNPPPGWYLTGNLGSEQGSGTYAMILDSNGTPVWYQRTSGQGAINVTPVTRNVVAWTTNPGPGFGTDADAAFSVFGLATQQTERLSARPGPLDPHELLPLPNGDYLLLATPLRAEVDLRRLGFGRSETIVDCLIQEVTATGRQVWGWRASAHVNVAESLHAVPVAVNRQRAYDVFHCNSVDRDPRTGDLLLSLRSTDAVYRIDRATGRVDWKVGGNPVVSDGARHVTVKNDPEGKFHGQHDARFQPNGNISLYDNHTWYVGSARAVVYHLDLRAGTATLVWEYRSPDGEHSNATGGFRRYADGDDNVITWGFKPDSLFTEVDAAGKLVLEVTLPPGDAAYRTMKAPPGEFDLDLLRRTAGLSAPPSSSAPRVFSVGVVRRGLSRETTSVAITGRGFTGATAVSFGSAPAASFSVDGDESISAVAPRGSGVVGVTVTTPGGTSAIRSMNMLTGSDPAFTAGTGSWKSSANTRIALSRSHSRSRPYGLLVQRKESGSCSTLTSDYPVAPNSLLSGAVWAKSSHEAQRLRSTLVFYDERDTVLWMAKGRLIRVSDRWTRVGVTGVTPAGATSVALAVEAPRCKSTISIDDAALVGSSRLVYGGSVFGISSVGPDHGVRAGGTVVTITGGGLGKATSVRFGAAEARSIVVAGDDTITAVSPPGSGTVDVSVATPSGLTPSRARGILPIGDSTFEMGPGSWVGNVNALAVSGSRARTGTHSLVSRPREIGFQSVISGAYSAAAGAVYHLRLWTRTQTSVGHVRPFMIFYGSSGEVVAIEQGPVFSQTSSQSWKSLSLDARAPEGTVGVAVGVDEADGRADLYLDDVSLTGSVRFTYR